MILTRDFVLAFLAQVTFTITFHILVPTLPIYLSRSGSTEVEIGILIGIFGISALIFRPFVGRGLLKIPEKNFMIAGASLFVLTSLGYLFAPPFWPFLMVRIIQGVGLAFFYTASFTLIANISPEIYRGESLSYFYLAQNISLILAPSLGMVIINHFGFTFLFFVCLGVSLSSLWIVIQLKRRQIVQVKDSAVGDRFFFNWKALPPSIISFFVYIVWAALMAFFPLFAIQNGVPNPGLFFTAIAAVLILGRSLGGKILDLYSRERMILILLAICVISMIILSFSRNLPMFILVGVIYGIGTAFLHPALMAYTLDQAGTARATAIGTLTAFSDLGMSIGPVIMGIVVRLTNYPMMFLCLAFIGVINLCYFQFLARKS